MICIMPELQSKNSFLDRSCEDGSTLRALFHAQGSPLKIDMGVIQDTKNIMNDPAMIEALTKIKNPIILTDDGVNKILPQDKRRSYQAQISAAAEEDKSHRPEFGSWSWSDRPAMTRAMQNIKTDLYESLERYDPRIASAMRGYVSSFIGVDEPNRAAREGEVIYTFLDVLANNHFIQSMPVEQKKEEGVDFYTLIRIPSEDSGIGTKVQRARQMAFLELNEPPESTMDQQSAMIITHEVEHALGNQIGALSTYYKSLKEGAEQHGCSFSLKEDLFIYSMAETESSLASVHALRSVVSEDLLKYDAAISMLMDFHVAFAQGEQAPTHFFTGFARSEYLDTGEIPDVPALMENTLGFFQKTRDIAHDDMAKSDLGYLATQIPLSVTLLMDAAHTALKADPPIYTPGEVQAAHYFIDAMENRLGLKAESYDQMLLRYKEVVSHRDKTESIIDTPVSVYGVGANP